MKTISDKQIRFVLHGIGADRVRHGSDDSWAALWYLHPLNTASDGHYVLIGRDTTEAVDYLRNYNTWAFKQLGGVLCAESRGLKC